jgi:hypothetical protein
MKIQLLEIYRICWWLCGCKKYKIFFGRRWRKVINHGKIEIFHHRKIFSKK